MSQYLGIELFFFSLSLSPFGSPVRIYWKSYCSSSGLGIGISGGLSSVLKFYVKIFM